MRLTDIFRRTRSRKPAEQTAGDWSIGYNVRDWADLPVHHPRTDRADR